MNYLVSTMAKKMLRHQGGVTMAKPQPITRETLGMGAVVHGAIAREAMMGNAV